MLAKKPAPIRVALLCICTLITATGRAADWQPKTAHLTRWAADVTPQNVHPEYPRPQMVREQWLNLNGLWDYAITPKEAPCPQQYDGQILVPFPIESALSGVMCELMKTSASGIGTFTVHRMGAANSAALCAVDWRRLSGSTAGS